MNSDFIEDEIQRRTDRATKLMERFPELAKCRTYDAFMESCEVFGLELDFVTSCSMFEQFRKRAKS